jgi:hypothetical protein
LDKKEVYYKLVAANVFGCMINKHRSALHQELNDLASDPVLFKRRLRMLYNLSDYESQVYKKINQFESSNVQDYILALRQISMEIQHVTNRCA